MEESGTQAKPFDNFDIKITLGNVSGQQMCFYPPATNQKRQSQFVSILKRLESQIYTKMMYKRSNRGTFLKNWRPTFQ